MSKKAILLDKDMLNFKEYKVVLAQTDKWGVEYKVSKQESHEETLSKTPEEFYAMIEATHAVHPTRTKTIDSWVRLYDKIRKNNQETMN